MLSCLFTIQCTLFYYLNSAISSNNKHELIQVGLLLHITIHKTMQVTYPKESFGCEEDYDYGLNVV